ncbi:hypothetical protein [Nitrosovibrio sp. Nv4]|uniref:hypothetical protein n=1 Tax=Nitrosovibrio sp. Nv4 TaxID=1945880 RepID=UPI000BC383A7|nr:hypothetical protein [Nitrosovibrio sp. Nv4]SOD41612.1 hypothetical protein SAMN06298226_1914 [Nitrosovibrio sp. Nv4]
MKTNDGKLVVVSGASRSGKTAYVRKAVKGEKRIMAWDPEDQWSRLPGWRRVTTVTELLRYAESPKNYKVGFVARGDLKEPFDAWAEAVFNAGVFVGPVVAIAEELSDVTTPSKAPGNWGVLLRRGLKRGIDIYAISQRWAEADKTAVGNASYFVLFRQSSGDDIRYLSRKTRVAESEIAGLKPLQFVMLNSADGSIVRDTLKF